VGETDLVPLPLIDVRFVKTRRITFDAQKLPVRIDPAFEVRDGRENFAAPRYELCFWQGIRFRYGVKDASNNRYAKMKSTTKRDALIAACSLILG